MYRYQLRNGERDLKSIGHFNKYHLLVFNPRNYPLPYLVKESHFIANSQFHFKVKRYAPSLRVSWNLSPNLRHNSPPLKTDFVLFEPSITTSLSLGNPDR